MGRLLSILQISDLHRDPNNPIRNDALLTSLENDRLRYTQNEPNIRSPDIVLVTGDIINGVPYGTTDPAAKLDEQYDEALEFLGQLTDLVVNGDRQRVVIVPGNHDVSVCHFIDSARRVAVAADRKRDLVSQLFSQGSSLRWSWPDLELFEIIDDMKYASRLQAFASFYQKFYEGTRRYDLDPAKQFDVFDFPEFNLTVAAFSSCFNNDMFNRQGAIHPGCIAAVSSLLRDPKFSERLRVAVWHHNTEGGPMKADYMDPGVLQNLIDSGISLGFHGHQHRPQFLDVRFRYGGDRRITVVSAGTLCGSASFRFGRAYNVIELDMLDRSGRLHLREMQNDDLQLPIWGKRSLPPSTSSFLDFQYDPPPAPLSRPDHTTTALLEAQALYDERKYQEAANRIDDLALTDGLARRLFLDCLGQLGDKAKIAARFDPPLSPTEVIYLMDALWAEGSHDRLRDLLTEPIVAASADPSVAELRSKYSLRLQK